MDVQIGKKQSMNIMMMRCLITSVVYVQRIIPEKMDAMPLKNIQSEALVATDIKDIG